MKKRPGMEGACRHLPKQIAQGPRGGGAVASGELSKVLPGGSLN